MSQKKTWTLRSLGGDVPEVMRWAPSLAAAATRLGVDKSSVFRWVKAGKIPAPGGRRRRVDRPVVPVGPEGWAAAIRAAYELSASETELVRLAETALALADDPAHPPLVRLAAMREFRAVTRQLNLEAPSDGEISTPAPRVRPYPQRLG